MTRDFPQTRWSLVARIGGSPSELATLVEIYAPAITRYLAAWIQDVSATLRPAEPGDWTLEGHNLRGQRASWGTGSCVTKTEFG